MKKTDIVRALAALAQETRLDIYRLLVQRGPDGMPAGDIAQKLGLANATLSFHLKALSHAGLVEARQDGRFIHYSAGVDNMNSLVAYLTENCCGGKSCAPACVPAAIPKRRKAA